MLVKVKIINAHIREGEDDTLNEFCGLNNGDIIWADYAENGTGELLFWIQCNDGVTYLRDGEFEVVDEGQD